MCPARTSIALAALAAFCLSTACTAESSVTVTFESEAIRKSVTEVKTFVFAAPAGAENGEPPPCERFDPRGLGPGDAEARTGITATYARTGPLKEPLAELSDVPGGRYTLIVEAWGPRCEEVVASGRDSSDTACARLATSGSPVLRGYRCVALELSASARKELSVALETFARIGSVIRVPADATAYDEVTPLPVVDGFSARDSFLVQLLDSSSDTMNGVAVRWTVLSGSGTFDGPEPTITGPTEDRTDGGYARATLRAGLTASAGEGGKIVVAAYAPGLEGAPITFVARSVRGVTVDVQPLTLPVDQVDLSRPDAEFQPIVVDDLDRDGRADIVLVGGTGVQCGEQHQLAVLYGRDGETFEAAYSPAAPGRVRALASARLDASGTRALYASVASPCSRFQNVVDGSQTRETYVIQSPGLEVWTGLDAGPASGMFSATRQLFTETTCTRSACGAPSLAPLTKMAIAIEARDIDGDGTDEVAMSRCSWVYATQDGQVPDVQCHGDLTAFTDSEVVLMRTRADGSNVLGFDELAIIGETHGDGGFREVRLADVNADGSLDLVFGTQTEIGVVCGRRNMPGTGFGFDVSPERADTPITFGQGFSIALGHFDANDGDDVVATGGLRAASPDSGLKLSPARDGCQFDRGLPPIITGPRAPARMLLVRTADLNADGFADAIVIHRDERMIETFFGNGTNLLARGPIVDLPAGSATEHGVFVEGQPGDQQVAVVAVGAPDENGVIVLRVRPAPR